jgi:hypothetical protein
MFHVKHFRAFDMYAKQNSARRPRVFFTTSLTQILPAAE